MERTTVMVARAIRSQFSLREAVTTEKVFEQREMRLLSLWRESLE